MIYNPHHPLNLVTPLPYTPGSCGTESVYDFSLNYLGKRRIQTCFGETNEQYLAFPHNRHTRPGDGHGGARGGDVGPHVEATQGHTWRRRTGVLAGFHPRPKRPNESESGKTLRIHRSDQV